MRQLPLTALRACAAIYETGGIRPAARTLGIAHSAVSRSLRELEAHLGVDLIERVAGRRLLTFTDEGHRVGKTALDAFGKLTRTLDSVARIEGRASVLLETTPSLATRWLFPRLGALETALPWIELSITIEQRIALPGRMRSDLALRMGQGPWDGFACEPLMDDELVAVASPEFLKNHNGIDWRHLPLLHDRDPEAAWSIWQDAFGGLGENRSAGPRYSSGDLVLRAAERSMGVALSRRVLAEESLIAGTLCDVGDGRAIPLPSSIWLVSPAHKQPRKPVARVMEWLRAQSATCRAS